MTFAYTGTQHAVAGKTSRHSHGDEIVLLLAGAAELTPRRDAGPEVVALSEPEDDIVVPRNTCHTASRVRAGTRMLCIRPGEVPSTSRRHECP